jgi:hypothetical protein
MFRRFSTFTIFDPGLPDYWRFTAISGSALLAEVFPAQSVAIHCYRNVLTAMHR